MPVLAILVGAAFLLALVAPLLWRAERRITAALVIALPAALTVSLALLAPGVLAGEAITQSIPWVPFLGLSLSFTLDGLSLLFALLISGMGALVALYADRYLREDPGLGRFHGMLLAFLASMLGLVLAEDLLLTVVFWGLTGLTSFLLIGFEHDQADARGAAKQALVVTAAGELALLAGVVLLGQVAGSTSLSSLPAAAADVRGDPAYPIVLLLILAGSTTKSAQVPFHFWLPRAMTAPTPVSAYLHSATMVTAGVYLLARLSPTLGGTPSWVALLVGIGGGTMLLGGVLSLRERDLKRILAYATISALGLMVLLLGVGGPLAAGAAMAVLLAHALYKGALFLVAGILHHESGTRDVERIGGLARLMPLTAVSAGLAALSMAGVAPMIGFAAKELGIKTALESPLLLLIAVLAASAAFVAVAGIVGIGPFIGSRRPRDRELHEATWQLWLAPLVLGLVGLVAGLLPWLGAGPLVSAATSAVTDRTVTTDVAPWYGLEVSFLLSLVSLAAGGLLFAARTPVRSWLRRLELGQRLGPDRGYRLAERATNHVAERLTALLQNGRLRIYLLVVVATLVVIEWPILVGSSALVGLDIAGEAFIWELGVAAAIVGGAVLAVRTDSRLSAVSALALVGYGIGVVYLLFGAPDLAMAQVLVETLTLLLFVLVVYHLPRMSTLTARPSRLRDGAIAAAAGGLVGAFVLAAGSIPADRVSTFFEDASQPLAHGRNVVNAILVDFRALDTLGEIVVLAIAGFGVVALLRSGRREGRP